MRSMRCAERCSKRARRSTCWPSEGGFRGKRVELQADGLVPQPRDFGFETRRFRHLRRPRLAFLLQSLKAAGGFGQFSRHARHQRVKQQRRSPSSGTVSLAAIQGRPTRSGSARPAIRGWRWPPAPPRPPTAPGRPRRVILAEEEAPGEALGRHLEDRSPKLAWSSSSGSPLVASKSWNGCWREKSAVSRSARPASSRTSISVP